jgi:peptidoglycan lytic transglycosylase D
LRLLAECVDTSVSDLQELNPSLLRMTTPKDQSFSLNLPAGSREKYENAIAAIPPDMRTWWRYHHVEYGDTLASIAHKYHSSSSSIAEANSLTDGEVKVGSKLIIPVSPGHSNSETASYSRRATHYKVRKGDTLYSIADDFEVPVDKLRKWNHLKGTTVATGRTLIIYKPVAAASSEEAASDSGRAPVKSSKKGKSKSSRSPVAAKYHKVKKGETLSSIAESNHISVAALKRDNPKLAADLRTGEVLVIRK